MYLPIIFDHKKLNNDISYYLHRPTATDKSMAPEGNDCFYVLVPVPNNQSNINWNTEGERMKKLVIIVNPIPKQLYRKPQPLKAHGSVNMMVKC